jgi:hypothetical protein
VDVPISTSTTLATRDDLFSANEQLARAGFLAGYSVAAARPRRSWRQTHTTPATATAAIAPDKVGTCAATSTAWP